MESLDYSDSNARIEVMGFSIETSFINVTLSIETLMEEIKPVVSEKVDFECRDKSKIVPFFFEFFDYQECEARHKAKGCSIEYPCDGIGIDIET